MWDMGKGGTRGKSRSRKRPGEGMSCIGPGKGPAAWAVPFQALLASPL